MSGSINSMGLLIGLLFTGTVLLFIRRRTLKERYALIWLVTGILMTVLSLFPSLLEFLAGLSGIYYPPSLLYIFGIIGALFILLHLSMAASSMSERIIKLTQTVAILEERLQADRDKI
ncbi:DUF2304 domain-containing protein [Paenibacillus nasutitermitis]|uniref:DUF2304 domain-containing protein n=1 Tax=Paenibacillus nasutitermitis TaxID=1652958 RepID=A0A917DSY8_9BACL|nr:DUF2304 domain-containing protein [Paenibacillus nasutitermitis]GGD65747.1 hypothetical protein GCM10010911_24420 [Paenibacillus nasutitermitis]